MNEDDNGSRAVDGLVGAALLRVSIAPLDRFWIDIGRLLIAFGYLARGTDGSRSWPRFFVAGVSDSDAPTVDAVEAPVQEPSATAVAKATNLFAWDLYAKACAAGTNAILSPTSIAIALAMASAGARGETLAQMSRALHVEGLPGAHLGFGSLLLAVNARDGRQGLSLHVANRLWGQTGMRFKPAFVTLLNERYAAPLGEVDFAHAFEQAREAINTWVDGETHNRIVDLIPDGALDASTRLVLVNAIYFKGAWRYRFEETETRDGPFMTLSGKITAKMMRQVVVLRYRKVPGAQLLELPYKGGMSMLVILPDSVQGLELIEKRAASEFPTWTAALFNTTVDLQLPRWTTMWGAKLRSILLRMGMILPFGNGDFSGITSDEALHIDEVIHRAFIDVNEKGAEAAAASAVIMKRPVSESPRPETAIFHADHPFLYVLRDSTTGLILFMGRVVDPG